MWRQATQLNMHLKLRHDPSSVLIFALFHGNLLWVKHSIRGWEVPGGKIEFGETPEAAAAREAFEEAGATLRKLQWMGEYAIVTEGETSYKWAYAAELWDVGARSATSEIVDVRFFHPPLTPVNVAHRSDISPIMKDEVYPVFWSLLQREFAGN